MLQSQTMAGISDSSEAIHGSVPELSIVLRSQLIDGYPRFVGELGLVAAILEEAFRSISKGEARANAALPPKPGSGSSTTIGAGRSRSEGFAIFSPSTRTLLRLRVVEELRRAGREPRQTAIVPGRYRKGW